MSRLTFIFANLGRGTAIEAERSWKNLAAHADGVDVVCPVEVDEGDKGYRDHAIMRRVFPASSWQAYAWKTRQPVLVRSERAVKRSHTWAAGVSVKHQSPARQVNDVVLDEDGEPDIEVDTTHFAAGYLNGKRPPLVKRLLGESWKRTRYVLNWRRKRAAGKGKHWVAFFDANTRSLADLQLPPHVFVIFKIGPDYGVAVPAPGWKVELVGRVETIETFIEKLHQGHRGTVRFTRV